MKTTLPNPETLKVDGNLSTDLGQGDVSKATEGAKASTTWTEPIDSLIDLISKEVAEVRSHSKDGQEWQQFGWMDSLQSVRTSSQFLKDVRRGLSFSSALLLVGVIGLALSIPGVSVSVPGAALGIPRTTIGPIQFGSSTMVLACFVCFLGVSCTACGMLAKRLHGMGVRLNRLRAEPASFLWINAIFATAGIGLLIWTADEFGFDAVSGIRTPQAFRRAVLGMCFAGLAIQFHYVRLLVRSLIASPNSSRGERA